MFELRASHEKHTLELNYVLGPSKLFKVSFWKSSFYRQNCWRDVKIERKIVNCAVLIKSIKCYCLSVLKTIFKKLLLRLIPYVYLNTNHCYDY